MRQLKKGDRVKVVGVSACGGFTAKDGVKTEVVTVALHRVWVKSPSGKDYEFHRRQCIPLKRRAPAKKYWVRETPGKQPVVLYAIKETMTCTNIHIMRKGGWILVKEVCNVKEKA